MSLSTGFRVPNNKGCAPVGKLDVVHAVQMQCVSVRLVCVLNIFYSQTRRESMSICRYGMIMDPMMQSNKNRMEHCGIFTSQDLP